METSDCLVGCIKTYNVKNRPTWLPGVSDSGNHPTDSMAPYVKVTFSDGAGEYVTVGNVSCPARDNHAIIKSFDCGLSSGIQATIEIYDEQGGSFTHFFDKIVKKMDNIEDYYKLQVEYGWIIQPCSGPAVPWINDSPLTLLMHDMEVSYSSGKIKYIIKATDLVQVLPNVRGRICYGDDKKHPMPLKDALIKLFEEGSPKMKVRFLKKNPDGSVKEDWDFLNDPKDKWEANNENKLSIAMRWIGPFRTKDNKGVTSSWDTSSPNPTIIFWEDYTPDCNYTGQDGRNIGTFIVNGGECSNVIEFTPKINWVVGFGAFNQGGNVGGGFSTKEAQAKNPCHLDENKGTTKGEKLAGKTIGTTPNSQIANNVGPEKAPEETAKSDALHERANIANTAIMPITAEMRIHGNPSKSFNDIVMMKGKTCSVVVINPFYISKEGQCGDWLAEPLCNDVLSNKDWFIDGCHHSIKDGSFTTTLKLYLMAPGINISGNKLGGRGYPV